VAEFPSLEIFTDAYLADTGDLTLEEHGAYHLMLYTAWRRPDNALPNDMDWLKRALAAHCKSLHGRTFNALIPRLLHRFWALDVDNNVWRQKRLDREREFRLKFNRNQSEIATKGWQKRRETAAQNEENQGLTNAGPLPAGNAPHPTPQEEERSKTLFNAPGTVREPAPPPRKYPNGSVTIEDPAQRIARFQGHLVDHLLTKHAVKDHGEAWDLVAAAFDPKHRTHARALAICRKYAADMGKGWPLQTPPRPP
jgi:uncharacterized protein YdaU (DUF1376 family)